jgi:putative DNA primase/helicase
MAERLRNSIESSGSGVRWTPEAGYFVLSRGVWRSDSLDGVRTRAQEVARSLWAEARELAAEIEGMDDADAKPYRRRVANLVGFAKHANSTRGIDSMIRELRALPGVAIEFADFDRHPDRMAVMNGVVNLRTGDLLDHDPGLLLTRRVDFSYDPAATAPRWERFLDEVFPAYPDLPAFVRRLVGYGVTGETSEQCFAVHYGKGANGKSVFTDTLTEVFRSLTVTTPFSTFEQKPAGSIPNDLAALKGARLVMASEGEAGRPMAEAVLKRVTGRDLISARFMRQEFFEFRPSFLLMLASNYKPAFRGQDDGLWRRVKLIPWERFFRPEERDYRLPEVLSNEAEGILAWAVRGAVEWYAGGLQDPDVIREGVAEYRAASDVLNGFLPGVFEEGDPDDKIKATEVFSEFQIYAEEHNFRDLKTWSSRGLYAALEERGFARKRSTGGTFYVFGLRKTEEAPRAGGARLAHVPSD